MKKKLNLYNFTLEAISSEHNTGCCVTSRHFTEKDNILYDREKRLTYLHYMGVKNRRITKLCELEKKNIPFKSIAYKILDKIFGWQVSTIPYKEIFLHYRFR
jgi:hypothetical protein